MALSLTVKQGETLYLGNDIRVTVVGHKGNRYTVAIDAPGVKILRAVHFEAERLKTKNQKELTTAGAVPSAAGLKLELGTPFEPVADGIATAVCKPVQPGNG